MRWWRSAIPFGISVAGFALYLGTEQVGPRAAGGIAGWLGLAWGGVRLIDALAAQRHARQPRLLRDLIGAALFIAALFAILANVFNQSIAGLLATSGVVVAVIGFALRHIIGDIFSGIALGVEHPYRLGDWLEVPPDIVGRVAEINWRATRLETRDATSVTIPNGLLAGSRFINFSHPNRQYRGILRIALEVRMPLEQAKALLLAATLGAPGVNREPAPDVLVESIDERGIVYAVRYWGDDYGRDALLRDAILCGILHALDQAGAAPAWPQRRLHPAPPPSLPEPQTLLGRVPLFDHFPPAALERLAAGSCSRHIRPGEVVVRQGEPGGSLFLIVQGALEVRVDGVPVDRMRAGEVFGEVSLLTGLPRSAEVRTLTEVTLLEITSDDIAPILREAPALADQLAELAAARQCWNRARLAEHAAPPIEEKRELLKRLRAFFGLGEG